MTERPAGCPHCRSLGEPSPREINGHVFTLDWREHPSGGGWEQWRWLCSCGARRRGQWTSQSDSVCYHAWLNHVKRSYPRRHLLGLLEKP